MLKPKAVCRLEFRIDEQCDHQLSLKKGRHVDVAK